MSKRKSKDDVRERTCVNLEVDTEYKTRPWDTTIPISVQIKSEDGEPSLYLHPNLTLSEDKRKHPTFTSPFAPLDYLDLDWQRLDTTETTEGDFVINIFMFFSFKDLEFLFADVDDYTQYLLPHLERKRRITLNEPDLSLPYVVYLNDKTWRVRMNVRDISAMAGVGGLSTYAKLAGVTMEDKDTYTREEKGEMLKQYIKDPVRFEKYALGDLACIDVYKGLNDRYNDVAESLGLPRLPRDEHRGLSTGKIVAQLLTEWLSKKIGMNKDDFYRFTNLAGTDGVTNLSRVSKSKNLVYLSMVDGGRAVKEKRLDVMQGNLFDIDISGCYGRGLANQDFAIGNPTINDDPITLGEFMKPKIQNQLVPGLWYARVSWHNAPFKQDVLLSKVEQAFKKWTESLVEGEGDTYDAAMVLAHTSVHQAALTHDLLQLLKNLTSRKEWAWLLKNAKVVSYMAYFKKDEKSAVTKSMREHQVKTKRTGKNGRMSGSHDWVRVPLREFMTILLDKRAAMKKEFGKKSPEELIYKLIINTTYGVIASAFFSEKGTGVSNVIVGNNITARARTLAWYMSKGLGLAMTVTDGGVGDANRLLTYNRTSLQNFFNVRSETYMDDSKHKFCHEVQMYGEYREKIEDKDDLDKRAWQHLAKEFPFADIFIHNQFIFETKDVYKKLVLHNKVDYMLVPHEGDQVKYSLRGMSGKPDLKGNRRDDILAELFAAIERDEQYTYEGEWNGMLSPADWKANKCKVKWQGNMLPHDNITISRTFFSLSPNGREFGSVKEHKEFQKEYIKAKDLGGDGVAEITRKYR